MDFEKAIRNAAIKAFSLTQGNIVGCYFHYTKALIKRAKELRLIICCQENNDIKILIGLLKILVHCPGDFKEKLFKEIKELFKEKGKKFDDFSHTLKETC